MVGQHFVQIKENVGSIVISSLPAVVQSEQRASVNRLQWLVGLGINPGRMPELVPVFDKAAFVCR